MGFFTRILTLLQDLAQALQNLARAVRSAAPTQEVKAQQAATQNEQTRMLRWTMRWTAVAAVAGSAAFVAAAVYADISYKQWQQARDQERRQLRAYMVLTDLALYCPDCGDTTFVPSVQPISRNAIVHRIENNGQTPAHQVSIVLNWWPVIGSNQPLPKHFKFPDQKATGQISVSDVGRDKTKDGSSGIADKYVVTFKEAMTGVSTLYIYGHVDYCDIFDTPHSTGFCFVYVPHAGDHLPICDRYNGEIRPRGHCAADQ